MYKCSTDCLRSLFILDVGASIFAYQFSVSAHYIISGKEPLFALIMVNFYFISFYFRIQRRISPLHFYVCRKHRPTDTSVWKKCLLKKKYTTVPEPLYIWMFSVHFSRTYVKKYTVIEHSLNHNIEQDQYRHLDIFRKYSLRIFLYVFVYL